MRSWHSISSRFEWPTREAPHVRWRIATESAGRSLALTGSAISQRFLFLVDADGKLCGSDLQEDLAILKLLITRVTRTLTFSASFNQSCWSMPFTVSSSATAASARARRLWLRSAANSGLRRKIGRSPG